MKNTNPSIKAKRKLKGRSLELVSESSLGSWKNGYTLDMVMRLLEHLEIMLRQDENMISALKWRLKYGLAWSTLFGWENKYPEFKERYADLKDIIADRIENKSLERQVDFQTFRFIAPRYSQDFKKLEEWRAKLKETQEQRPTHFIYKAVEVTTDIPHCKDKPKAIEGEIE